MSIENVRFVETLIIDQNDPRYEELLKEADAPDDFVQDTQGRWSVRGTGEPVTFATKADEDRYKHGLRQGAG